MLTNYFYDTYDETVNIGIDAYSQTLSFSGNSSISFNTNNLPTNYNSTYVLVDVYKTDLCFDLSAADANTPMFDINLKSLEDGRDWSGTQSYTIGFSDSKIVLSGLENLADGKYCLLNVSTPTAMTFLGGINEAPNITIEQSDTNYAVYYTHTGGAVPEPATASLSLFGLAALMMRRRRA